MHEETHFMVVWESVEFISGNQLKQWLTYMGVRATVVDLMDA
jgi:hypothetical protein